MIRAVLGVIVGYLVWTALWLGGNSIFFGGAAAVVPFSATASLVGLLVLSIVCSLAAGLAAAAIAKGRARGALLALAGLLLLTGVAVQSGVWALMPLWYHLTFLVLIVPATVLGGRLLRRPA